MLADVNFIWVRVRDGCSLGGCSSRFHICGHSQKWNVALNIASRIADEPRCKPPPSPVILFNLDVPPAFILASRRSRRIRACSEALEGGVLPGDDVVGGVSAMLKSVGPVRGVV